LYTLNPFTPLDNIDLTFEQPYIRPVILTLDEGSQKINLLRNLRDEPLLKQRGGKDYVMDFYQHVPEVPSFPVNIPDLMVQLQKVILESMPICHIPSSRRRRNSLLQRREYR
jgi:hypothetical protein